MQQEQAKTNFRPVYMTRDMLLCLMLHQLMLHYFLFYY